MAGALALEVNDGGLLLLREGEGRPRPDSPGLAWFEGDAVRVGVDAARQWRQKPRAIYDRFGPARLVWGSDFPHILLKIGYRRALLLPQHCPGCGVAACCSSRRCSKYFCGFA